MINLEVITKTKGNRYVLIISNNNEEEKHVVSENLIIKYNLLTPRELSRYEYKTITNVKIEDILFEKALVFIDYKMRTISEVKKRLKKEVADEELINKVIKELKEKKYLNDNFYTETFIKEKIDFDLIGPRNIKQKLISKGIHFDIIDQHLIQYNDHMQYDKINDIIKNQIKYKIKKPYKKAYLSLKQKLVTKGFSLNIIESALISNAEEIKEMIDDIPLLKRELDKLTKRYDVNKYEEKSKVIKALLSKGFDYETIKSYVKEGTFYEDND